jgi:hypothetical protein
MRISRATYCLLLTLIAQSALAMFAMPPDVPVDRLIKNVGAYIKEHPDDADGYYTLGRINSLAFSVKSTVVRIYEDRQQPAGRLPRFPHFPGPRNAAPPPATEEQLRQYMTDAIVNLRKAIEMSPKNGLYHLTLAFALEQGVGIAGQIGPIPPDQAPQEKLTPEEAARLEALVKKLGHESAQVREAAQSDLRAAGLAALPVLKKHAADADAEVRHRVGQLVAAAWSDPWRQRAIDEYLQAWELSISADLALKNLPITGIESLVSFEAGNSYKRLVEARGATAAEKERIAAMDKDLEKLRRKPMGAITPIVFALDRERPLRDLLAEGTRVRFDLDGTGRGFRWSWVKGDTAILAWDPRGTGRIESGMQLFGSVTWHIYWPDGYRALGALDDDRDGQLSGAELRGLVVWRDADGDGRSSAAEVVSVESAGITMIRTRPTHREDGAAACREGLHLRGGQRMSTFDWQTAPLAE